MDGRRVQRKATWGTCAGLILLAEVADRTKKGGQDLIGGLDVRVQRNFFGRQAESFEVDLDLPFLKQAGHAKDTVDEHADKPFRGIFIRAPIVERILSVVRCEQVEEAAKQGTVVALSRSRANAGAGRHGWSEVEIMGVLKGRRSNLAKSFGQADGTADAGDIIAVKQGNVFGTSFHPELTQDGRIHAWWLQQVKEFLQEMPECNVHIAGTGDV